MSRSAKEAKEYSLRKGENVVDGGGGSEGGLGMMLHFNAEEAQEMIRGVDSLRAVYERQGSFLEAWEGGVDRVGGGLDLGRAGVKFHRDRLWDLLQKNISKPTKGTSSSSSASPVVLSPSSPTITRLSSMHHQPPLSPPLISTYLRLPYQYHPSDPLLLLFELHLRALLLPLTGQREFDAALERVEKAAKVKGYDGWEAKMRRGIGGGQGQWIGKEDRERMRECLGSKEMRERLGEKRAWWGALDFGWSD